MSGAQYLSSQGRRNGLEDEVTTIYLELENQNVEQEMEVITYPNPVSNVLTIHANNSDEIRSVQIYNTLGQQLQLIENINSNHFEFSTSNLAQGFYMARVETMLGVSIEKVQIVRD